MLTGYVDDTTDALAATDPGVRFEEDKLVLREDPVEEDKNIPEDERIKNVLKQVADTVYKCVQFTVDFPSAESQCLT